MNSVISDTAIADAKLMLMSSNPIDQLLAAQWIQEILDYSSGDERDRLINRLIDANVVTYLCEKVGEHYGPFFTTTLKIIDKLIFSEFFYKYKLAYEAMRSIVRVANIMTQNMEVHEKTLSVVAYTIYRVLNRASTIQVSIDTVCDLEQMVLFIKKLCPPLSKKYTLRVCTARTMILVMKYIQPGNNEEIKSSLLTAFRDSLISIHATVLQHIDSLDSELLHCAMEIMISTCAIGTRFCEETGDGAHYVSSITEELIEIIIPNFRKIRFPIDEGEQNQKNLFECLAKILRFKRCDKNLAIVLATNGFIKYFFASSSTSLQASMESIVLDVIVTLSKNTHDWAILERSFNREVFPVEMSRKWLENGGNVQPTVAIEYPRLISQFLVSIVETSSASLLNRALEAITTIKSDDKYWIIVSARVWELLPTALAACSVENAKNVEGLIDLALSTDREDNFLEIYREAIATLKKVLTMKDIGNNLKILLLQCVHTSLTVSHISKNSQVVEFIVNQVELLYVLRDAGFADKNCQLSGLCADLLVYIVECQREFQVQGEVVEIEPLALLDLLQASDNGIRRVAMRLLHILLNPGGAILLSVIISDFKNVEAANKAIYGWYVELHQMLPKTQISDRSLVYRCLYDIVKFCKKNEFFRIFRRLYESSYTHELVQRMNDDEHTDLMFEFLRGLVYVRENFARRPL